MKNFIQPGNTLPVIAPANVLSGGLVVVGSIVGVAAYDALATQEVEVDVEGCFTLPKTTTDVVTQGAKLYWNSSTSKLTITPGTGSKPLVGYATKAAGNGATTVDVKLLPSATTGPA